MAERAKFFDDIAGVAGGAFSAIAGVGEELGALVRTRVDEALAKLALVRREEFEVVSELASQARSGQEQAEARLAVLESRVAALEAAAKTASVSEPVPPVQPVDEPPHDPHAHHGAPGGPPEGESEAPPAAF
jgi:BMFP domain-containing protein YqiC